VVQAEQLNHRLRHYYLGTVAPGTRPVLLIPPLMLTSEVWDIAPSASAVATPHQAGIDPWVVDFGDPSRAGWIGP
jgi:putative long chain acyl-CoA synthase